MTTTAVDLNKSRTFAGNSADDRSFSYTSTMKGAEKIIGITLGNGDQQSAGSLGIVAYIDHLLRQ